MVVQLCFSFAITALFPAISLTWLLQVGTFIWCSHAVCQGASLVSPLSVLCIVQFQSASLGSLVIVLCIRESGDAVVV